MFTGGSVLASGAQPPDRQKTDKYGVTALNHIKDLKYPLPDKI